MKTILREAMNLDTPQEKPILTLDFDGCINSYSSGWEGAAVINDPPVEGTAEFLLSAIEHFTVTIHSSRSHQPGGIEAMKQYVQKLLQDHTDDIEQSVEIAHAVIQYPTYKPPSHVSIDDNAVRFTGQWMDPKSLLELKPWHKQ